MGVVGRGDHEPLDLSVVKQFLVTLGRSAAVLLRKCLTVLFRPAKAVDDAEPITSFDGIGKNLSPTVPDRRQLLLPDHWPYYFNSLKVF